MNTVRKYNNTWTVESENVKKEIITIAKEIESAPSKPSAKITKISEAPVEYQNILTHAQKEGKYSGKFNYKYLDKIKVQDSFTNGLLKTTGWNRIPQLTKAQKVFAAQALFSRDFDVVQPIATVQNMFDDSSIDYPSEKGSIRCSEYNIVNLDDENNEEFRIELGKAIGMDLEDDKIWRRVLVNAGKIKCNKYNEHYMKSAVKNIMETAATNKKVKKPFEIVAEPSTAYLDKIFGKDGNPYKKTGPKGGTMTPDVVIRYGDKVVVGEVFSGFGGESYRKGTACKHVALSAIRNINISEGLHSFSAAATCLKKNSEEYKEWLLDCIREYGDIDDASELEVAVVNWIASNDNVVGETNMDAIYNLLYAMLSSEELVGKGPSLAGLLPIEKHKLFLA